MAILFLIISQIKRIRRQIKMLCTPPYLFLGFFVASVFTASVIDLEILPYGILYTLEEMFELSASIALIFCDLSLFPVIRQVHHSHKRLH
jgi:amino acid transporter